MYLSNPGGNFGAPDFVTDEHNSDFYMNNFGGFQPEPLPFEDFMGSTPKHPEIMTPPLQAAPAQKIPIKVESLLPPPYFGVPYQAGH
jgi:hypothetical protein